MTDYSRLSQKFEYTFLCVTPGYAMQRPIVLKLGSCSCIFSGNIGFSAARRGCLYLPRTMEVVPRCADTMSSGKAEIAVDDRRRFAKPVVRPALHG